LSLLTQASPLGATGEEDGPGADLKIVRLRRSELHPGIIHEQGPQFIPEISPEREEAGQREEVSGQDKPRGNLQGELSIFR
jgi:hypothetical protein